MAAIPRDLLESELFGHERGAFSGAQNRRLGRFEQADAGTLFLDEIGDMPAELPTRLLRVLAEGEFYRDGGIAPSRVDVRIIAATHQNLEELVAKGVLAGWAGHYGDGHTAPNSMRFVVTVSNSPEAEDQADAAFGAARAS